MKLLRLGIMLCCIMALLVGCSQASMPAPKAKQGILDLTDGSQPIPSSINLAGEWKFYWLQLLTPAEIAKKNEHAHFINVPLYWNDAVMNDEQLTGTGYGTYYLTLRVPDEWVGKQTAFSLPLAMTSYQLWLDGERVGQNGIVGTSKEESWPQYLPLVIPHQPTHNEIELVLQVSNYYQFNGGLWESPKYGLYSAITREQNRLLFTELILLGVLLMSGAYHTTDYLLRRKERSNLYFGLFCLLVSVRTMVSGQMALYQLFPEFNWYMGVKMEYIGFVLGAGCLVCFAHSMFTRDSHKLITFAFAGTSVLFSTAILFLTPFTFSRYMLTFQIFTFLVLIYCLYIFVRAVIHERAESWLTFILFLIFSITAVNDLLYNSQMISTFNMAHIGLIFLVFGQSIILKKDVKRMEELSALDGLTGIPNRRKFNEVILEEWEQAIHSRRPLSLILIDIDYYKEYNDTYGHLQGDRCLQQVAHTILHCVGQEAGLVARYGGEEFCVLLPQTELEQANKIGEIIRESIENKQIPHKGSIVNRVVTVSVGVATVTPVQEMMFEQLIHKADAALYKAKSTGRNRVIGVE